MVLGMTKRNGPKSSIKRPINEEKEEIKPRGRHMSRRKEGNGGGGRTSFRNVPIKTFVRYPLRACILASNHIVLASSGGGELRRKFFFSEKEGCYGARQPDGSTFFVFSYNGEKRQKMEMESLEVLEGIIIGTALNCGSEYTDTTADKGQYFL